MKLGDLCRFVNGDAYRDSDWSRQGIPIIRIQNLNDHTKPFNYWAGVLNDRVCIKNKDLLLAWSGTPGTSFGAHIWTRGKAVLNQHIFRVDYNSEKLDAEFARHAINERLQVLIGKAHGGVGLSHVTKREVETLEIPLPPLAEQRRIATILQAQMATVEKARAAAERQIGEAIALANALIRESVSGCKTKAIPLREALVEIKAGVGPTWKKYPVLGATRAGLALAREPVGKQPERYKLVDPQTVFYNPMRILLGSIALVDDGDQAGITSPDYVAVKGRPGLLDTRWFYYWFRSHAGAALVMSLSRGAVRERMLFTRLAEGVVQLPDFSVQQKASACLAAIPAIQKAAGAQLADLEKLPAALLRQAFAGAM